jgi:hypothetical protein
MMEQNEGGLKIEFISDNKIYFLNEKERIIKKVIME